MRAPAAIVALALLAAPASASAEVHADVELPWYRHFYTRVGVRDVVGMHAWAAASFGLGYRYARARWGIDGSVLNLQYDGEEGLHTAARVAPYLDLAAWGIDGWLGAGLSYGWAKGTVDRPIAKRNGQGLQVDVLAGYELPRALRVRLFVHAAFTAPLYNTYDLHRSSDSPVYVYALEAAIGVRF